MYFKLFICKSKLHSAYNNAISAVDFHLKILFKYPLKINRYSYKCRRSEKSKLLF